MGAEIDIALITRVIVAAIIMVITAIVAHALSKLLKRLLMRDGSRVQYSTIFVNIERMVVWTIGLSIMLASCFGIDVTALVAALGIGGIAISLGMQDTISNLIGGLQLSFKNIVTLGDYVSVGSTIGVVKDITWRYTVIQAITGDTTIVPNSIMINQALTKRPPWNKVKAMVNLPFETVEFYEKQGEGVDQLKADMAEAVRKRLTDSAPSGLGLTLESDVIVFLRNAGDYAYEGYVTALIKQEEPFDRLMIEDAIVCATAPFTCKGRQ